MFFRLFSLKTMSTTVKESDTLMKVTDIKVETSDSENMAEVPVEALE